VVPFRSLSALKVLSSLQNPSRGNVLIIDRADRMAVIKSIRIEGLSDYLQTRGATILSGEPSEIRD
jgi:hypothetical protein